MTRPTASGASRSPIKGAAMTRVKRTGLTLFAVFAASAIPVSSASATTFLAHPNSGTFPLLVLGLTQGPQVFSTAAGTIECKHFGGHGLAEALETLQSLTAVSVTGCTAFGLAAKITTGKFLFNAHGLISLENTITITTTGCTVTIPSSKNQNLEKVLYLNIGNDILIHSDVNGITSSGTGAACTYAEESKGTYRGLGLNLR